MEEAFSEAFVICNHLPNFPELEHCITGKHFALMRQGATFINTGRGRQVDETALAKVFGAREDLTALLDVSDPEPPRPGSPLYSLPNVQLSSHIAGLAGNERQRLVDVVVADLERFIKGLSSHYGIQLEELAAMA